MNDKKGTRNFCWQTFFKTVNPNMLPFSWQDTRNDLYKSDSTTFYQDCKMHRGSTLMYDGSFSHFFNRKSSPFLTMGIYDAFHSLSNSFCMCLHCTFQKKMQNIFMAFVHLLQSGKLHADGLSWKFKFSLYW